MAWTGPRTWVAAEVVTASLLNTHLRDNLKAIGDAWTSYNPTWTGSVTNPAIGNGTIVGASVQAGKLTHVRVRVTAGSTTTFGSGSYSLSLPVSKLAADPGRFLVVIVDTSAGGTFQGATYNVSGTTAPIAVDNGTAGGALAAISPTVPYTMATTDIIDLVGTYEAA